MFHLELLIFEQAEFREVTPTGQFPARVKLLLDKRKSLFKLGDLSLRGRQFRRLIGARLFERETLCFEFSDRGGAKFRLRPSRWARTARFRAIASSAE